jgi:hypothetical protein
MSQISDVPHLGENLGGRATRVRDTPALCIRQPAEMDDHLPVPACRTPYSGNDVTTGRFARL